MPRQTARTTAPQPERDRRAWAAPARPRAPSARETGAQARCWRGSCDQGVVAGQRPDLDRRLVASAATAGAQRAGVLARRDRPVAREHPAMAAGEFAGVQAGRGDGALIAGDLDAPADQL